MQRVFTLELRVDYRDKDKLGLIRAIMSRAAREVYGAAALLNDHIKPQVAIFSDDFFQTHEELALMPGVGEEAPSKPSFRPEQSVLASSSSGTGEETLGGGEETISPELLAALR